MADKTKLEGLLCPQDVVPVPDKVCNIVQKDRPLPAESECGLYISIHRKCILKEERKKKRQAHQTFGLAEVPIPKPSEYLKKNGGVPRPKPEFEKHDHSPAKRVPIPIGGIVVKEAKLLEGEEEVRGWDANWKRGRGARCPCAKRGKVDEDEAEKQDAEKEDTKIEAPEKKKEDLSQRHKENYISKNILNAIRAIPRPAVPKYVDTRKGATHVFEASGLVPKYKHKVVYGEFPAYHAKECLDKEHEVLVEAEKKMAAPSVAHYITKYEKQQLLDSFKEKWAEVQKEYQTLPFVIDTIPKRNRVVSLDKKLKEFEDDIRQLEEAEYILVIPDPLFDTIHGPVF